MRKISGAIIAFSTILILGGCSLYQNTANNQPPQSTINLNSGSNSSITQTPSISNSKTVEVEMTDQGFSPNPITVSVGTTVKFVNRGQEKHWPASAPHPQHTDLPGFDALKGIDPGESYEYTFVKLGNWKYHDHLNPKLFSSVNVTE